jgi:hypothetical protein
MSKKISNLGDFNTYDAANKKKSTLTNVLNRAKAQTPGNYSLKITSPNKGKTWTIWLMKD